MKKIILSSLIIFTLGLAACGNTGTESTDGSEGNHSSEVAQKDITITDANGEITVPYQPKKVVVFDNSALDTLNTLGLGDVVVGAPTSNLPSFLSDFKSIESAGGIKEPDLEKINQMQPDLIIISGRQRDFLPDLEKIAPTIFFEVDSTDTWNSIQHNALAIGQIFGKEAQAQTALDELATTISATKEKAEASEELALVVLMNEGELSAYGNGSRFSIVHNTFGFKQADEAIEASTHGQNISYEYILQKNPDVIFVVDRTKAVGGDQTETSLADNDLVKDTNAGKNGKVIVLNSEVWYLAGSGLESLKIMLDDVNQALK
ncbi:MAG TPA: siderophore ABC transporter substrate-binding protein [Candidatus Enterococcus avicola]|uniref:Siderophore ABC transporter substrate-binding protein n=1 Tax=Candidatus Enterococcus avicola TaxID=2838561 RepID=A0A9D2F6G5_9ENTE|nr:siderophore ABC transporter substrate-binding protein [Candidatus Enterococcus avicola]